MNGISEVAAQLRELDDESVEPGQARHYIEVLSANGEVTIGANREGLIWLALQFAELACRNEPGAHVHLDQASMADRADLAIVLRRSKAPWGN
jgi:hypothetical protein